MNNENKNLANAEAVDLLSKMLVYNHVNISVFCFFYRCFNFIFILGWKDNIEGGVVTSVFFAGVGISR